MDATLLAGVTLDDSAFVNDGQLVLIGCDLDIVNRNDADDGEESAGWLPALGTSACVVVKNVASDGHLHFVAWASAMAMQLSAREVVASLGETAVDQWMKRWCHGDMYCLFLFGIGDACFQMRKMI